MASKSNVDIILKSHANPGGAADPRTLKSDSTLDIPLHVRQYLAKHERTRDDMELLRDMETQIVVLRAVGAPS